MGAAGFLLTDRTVYTYAPDEQNLALATGYPVDTMFVVEHLVVFPGAPPRTLLALGRAGLAQAWARGYASVVFCLPDARGRHWRGLASFGRRLGFVRYSQHDGLTWWICRRPPGVISLEPL